MTELARKFTVNSGRYKGEALCIARQIKAMCKPFFNTETVSNLDEGELSDFFEVIHDKTLELEASIEQIPEGVRHD